LLKSTSEGAGKPIGVQAATGLVTLAICGAAATPAADGWGVGVAVVGELAVVAVAIGKLVGKDKCAERTAMGVYTARLSVVTIIKAHKAGRICTEGREILSCIAIKHLRPPLNNRDGPHVYEYITKKLICQYYDTNYGKWLPPVTPIISPVM
jgi:hypothetical protein